MPSILGANSTSGAFEVTNSLRFNDGDSAYLNRSLGSGNQKTFTFSAWIKRGVIGTEQHLFGQREDDSNRTNIFFTSGDLLNIRSNSSGAGLHVNIITTQVFRDVSAWYHIVVAVDTEDSTEANRVKVFVNGTQVTSFGTETYPAEDATLVINNAVSHEVGSYDTGAGFFDGYMAEVVFIDGTQLAATSFGEFDEDTTTVWKPINVGTLTFGTNGFYLNFKDSSNLGDDAYGGTDWTENNIAATDQSTDTCTNNFCTLNPLQIGPRNSQSESAGTFSEGNLNVLGTGTADDFAGTIAVSTGKWFYEVKLLTALNHGAGFVPLDDFTSGDSSIANGITNGSQQYGTMEGGSSSRIANNGDNSVSPQNNFDDDDIISFAFDIDGGTLKIYNNGSLDRTISSIPADTYIPMGGDSSSTDASLAFNFGSPAYSESGGNSDGSGYGNFSMAVPSGYFSICTKNLAEYG
jgi:hypothetical protein